MTALTFLPLHTQFGVEVNGLDLRNLDSGHYYDEIRDAFETHSLLLFRHQDLDDDAHFRVASLFGPIENREKGRWGKERDGLAFVSNVSDGDGDVIPEDEERVLNLKANQLWHTDSTFLPAPALANILAARVVTTRGGETELVSTRAAWRDMPNALKSAAQNAVFIHRYSHSRAQIDPDLADKELFTMWDDQAWRAVWPNPVNTQEALYIASHVHEVMGVNPTEGQALVQALIKFCTQHHYVYRHQWTPGDVLIWDERATMHRGRPWPYAEPRTLASLCVTARDQDGLNCVRVD